MALVGMEENLPKPLWFYHWQKCVYTELKPNYRYELHSNYFTTTTAATTTPQTKVASLPVDTLLSTVVVGHFHFSFA